MDGDETAEQKGIFLTGIDRVPDFEAAGFTNPTTIDNTYLPLIPGTTLTYEAETEDGVETIITEVLNTTRVVDGVECVVFNDQVFLDGLLIEDTNDWFAQDDEGNVWYMGEEVTNYEYDDDDNLIGTDHDGAWEAGVDDALPGIVMWADPEAGVSYYQEYYEDEAEDMGMVVALGVRVELENGTTYEKLPADPGLEPPGSGRLRIQIFCTGRGSCQGRGCGRRRNRRVDLIKERQQRIEFYVILYWTYVLRL